MNIDELAIASGFSVKDVARYRPMMERMIALTRELALAEQDITKPDADGWIPWAGGECPIPDAKAGEYEIIFRDLMRTKAVDTYSATAWVWRHLNGGSDITAYRLIKR